MRLHQRDQEQHDWLAGYKVGKAEAAANADRRCREALERIAAERDRYREALERIVRGNGLSAQGHPMAMSGWAAFGIARAALDDPKGDQ